MITRDDFAYSNTRKRYYSLFSNNRVDINAGSTNASPEAALKSSDTKPNWGVRLEGRPCTDCGTENDESRRECYQCGKLLDVSEPALQVAFQSQDQVVDQAQIIHRNDTFTPPLIIILIIITMIGLLVEFGVLG